MGPLIISSAQNERIKHLRHLRDCQEREGEWFFLEGRTLIREALRNGWEIDSIYAVEGEEIPAGPARSFRVSERILQSISSLKHTPGILAVARKRLLEPGELDPGPLSLLLDRIQDPGNVGALIRSAAAFGVTGVFSSPGTAHFYNPKVVRAAMGSLFHLQLCENVQLSAVESLLRLRQLELIVADSRDGEAPERLSADGKYMLLLGHETAGVSPQWRALPHRKVRVPLSGAVESLNVAVAGSILLYEFCGRGMK